MTAHIRVFLLTHRRPHLLRRAMKSLLAQTFTDWRCELHNDAPDDASPEAVLHELAPADPRFEYRHHDRNWGPVASFNHAFAGGPEPYASILEDDNWWEPNFLERMIRSAEAIPAAALVWSNMRLWQEQLNGEWTETGKTIWPMPPGPTPPVVFRDPEVLQAFDALHSNGAMLFRPDRFRPKLVPSAAPFAIIEQLRERAALGPLVLIPEPLAHFAMTRMTGRTYDRIDWIQSKLLVAASFLHTHDVPETALRMIWDARRSQRPRDTDMFFHLAWALRRPGLIRHAGPVDWAHFILSSLRHPLRLVRGLQFRSRHPEVWSWLAAPDGGSAKVAIVTLTSKNQFSMRVALS